MQHLLGRFFDVRPGEGTRLAVAALAVFTLLAGHTLLETARDTLFLQWFEASRLTGVYASIAGLTLLASPVSIALARRFGRRNALVTTLLAAAYGTAVLYLLPLRGATVAFLYAWTGLLASLLSIQFWLFVSELLTVAQGKRLFGPIAAGGALGAVVGAALSAVLLRWITPRGLVLGAAACFVVAALVLSVVRGQPATERPPWLFHSARSAKDTMVLVRRDPYVLRLAGLAFVAQGALLAVDYLFKSSAAREIAPEQLGPFFGSYYALLNAGSLVMQLAVSAPLIRRLGVVVAAAVLPMLLLGFGALAVLGGVPFWAVLLVKSSDGALRHSLHRISSELVQMPLEPQLQERVKPFIDGPLPRAAQALTAGVLLLLSQATLGSPTPIALLGLGLAGVWLALAISLRRPYLQRFRDALARPGFDHRAALQELDLRAVEILLDAISSPDPARAIGAMELLRDKQRVKLIPALVLRHESEAVLVRALDILAESRREDWLLAAERLLEHRSESVRAAALRALSLHGRHQALERALADPSAAVRARAAFWLVTLEEVAQPLGDARIQALLELPDPERRAAELALLSAIQDAPHPRWTEVLLVLSRTPDAAVFEQVALAMAEIADVRFVQILIPRLATRDGRGAVREALCALGEPALDALEVALADPRTPERVRIHLPRTISAFKSQRAADVLLSELENPERSGAMRYKALRGLGRLVMAARVRVDPARIDALLRDNLIEHLRVISIIAGLASERPEAVSGVEASGAKANGGEGGARGRESAAQRSLRLVLGLLDDKRQQSLERVFRLLQIRHKNEDIRGVYVALTAGDRRRRAHALEFLDVLSSTWPSTPVTRDARELLLVSADELGDRERAERAARFLPFRPKSYAEALALLLADQDDAIAAFAAYHALALGSSDLEQQVLHVLRERPNLNRVHGETTLFPAPLEVRHAT